MFLQAGPVQTGDLEFQKLLECPICADYLQTVQETPCCHSLFCQQCLASWNRSNRSCPGCRMNLELQRCTVNVPIQRFVDSIPLEVKLVRQLLSCDDLASVSV